MNEVYTWCLTFSNLKALDLSWYLLMLDNLISTGETSQRIRCGSGSSLRPQLRDIRRWSMTWWMISNVLYSIVSPARCFMIFLKLLIASMAGCWWPLVFSTSSASGQNDSGGGTPVDSACNGSNCLGRPQAACMHSRFSQWMSPKPQSGMGTSGCSALSVIVSLLNLCAPAIHLI